MNKTRIYMDEATVKLIENKGWVIDEPSKYNTILQVSVKYYDMIGNEIISDGSEDFRIDKYNQMKKDNKIRYTVVKHTPTYAKKQTLMCVYTYSTATIKQIEIVIDYLAKKANIKYDLLKTK